MSVLTETQVGTTALRPFTINTPEADVVDLRRRVAATPWPEQETTDDQSQGVQLDTIQALARHWATEYDWSKCVAGFVSAEIEQAAATGAPAPVDPSAEQTGHQLPACLRLQTRDICAEHGGPSADGARLADSPVGLAAFLLDHDAKSLALSPRVFAGQKEGLTRDDVLDSITLFWLTDTALSSARLHRENKLSFFGVKGVTVPSAVSVLPDEIYRVPRGWAEKAYKLIYFNPVDKGGYFASWEQPEIGVEEVPAGFASLR